MQFVVCTGNDPVRLLI